MTTHLTDTLDHAVAAALMFDAGIRASQCESPGREALRWEVARLVGEVMISRAAAGRSAGQQTGGPDAAACDVPSAVPADTSDFEEQILFRIRAALSAADGCAEHSLSVDISGIRREGGGVIHAVAGARVVILLPDLCSITNCDRAVGDLIKIYDDPERGRRGWIVDFSSVTACPSLVLVGLLNSLRDDLAARGAHLALVWFRPELFPPRFMARLSANFDLELAAGCLFTRKASAGAPRG